LIKKLTLSCGKIYSCKIVLNQIETIESYVPTNSRALQNHFKNIIRIAKCSLLVDIQNVVVE